MFACFAHYRTYDACSYDKVLNCKLGVLGGRKTNPVFPSTYFTYTFVKEHHLGKTIVHITQ